MNTIFENNTDLEEIIGTIEMPEIEHKVSEDQLLSLPTSFPTSRC